jgi:hypothetical protein
VNGNKTGLNQAFLIDADEQARLAAPAATRASANKGRRWAIAAVVVVVVALLYFLRP